MAERTILGAFEFGDNKAVLHSDLEVSQIYTVKKRLLNSDFNLHSLCLNVEQHGALGII